MAKTKCACESLSPVRLNAETAEYSGVEIAFSKLGLRIRALDESNEHVTHQEHLLIPRCPICGKEMKY